MKRHIKTLAALAALLTAASLSTTTPAAAKTVKRATVEVTNESYGPDPLQVVTVSRQATSDGKTVIFLHGGGWTTGGRGSLMPEAADWAANGWVAINVSYRVGIADGVPDDGKLILADVETVLNTYRLKPYVDPTRIVVYGESAGGHLATWLGSKDGAKVKAIVAISPVSSISGAIAAGNVAGAPDNVIHLGEHAQEFFGYSVGTTDAHRYLGRVQHARVVVGVDHTEWVDPDIHGRAFCLALGRACHLDEIPGGLHGGAIAAANPTLVTELRQWADTQVG
jgi:acetyl esterase/lipase